MKWLRRALTPPSDSPALTSRVEALETHARALYDHIEAHRREIRSMTADLQQLRQEEARRAAEHASSLDALQRIYKRISSRIVRDEQTAAAATAINRGIEESVMELRKRLGR